MAIMYRVEDARGNGPYRPGLLYGLTRGCFKLPKHPTPNEDTLLMSFWSAKIDTRGDYLFGFDSIEQYEEWFDCLDNRKAHDDVGSLKVYYVPDEYYHKGTHQSIAHKDRMTLINELSLFDCRRKLKVA